MDYQSEIKKYDRSGMLKVLEGFPEQCLDAVNIGSSFKLPDNYRKTFRNIVCTGLGGSAIGADIARSYAADESKTPIFVNRNYALPDFTGEESLVITSSYSGNTEETISAYRDAKKRRSKIIAITSGGELKKSAEADGYPVITIPGTLQPRCALGYSFFPLLILLSGMGVVGGQSKHIEETISILKGLRNSLADNDNKAGEGKNISKRIAASLHDKFPVIYGAQDHIDCVITRWRGQLAENSKTLSSGHVLPEMNHNEIVGWQFPEKVLKNFIAVILRDAGDSRPVSKRLDITEEILRKEGVETMRVESTGNSLLARVFSLIYTGDFVSFYLAILNGVDPTPVDRITYLKKELSGG